MSVVNRQPDVMMKVSLRPSRRFVTGTLLFLGLSSAGLAAADGPTAVFLTWRQDPTTTMTIDWHTVPGQQMGEVAFQADGADSWSWKSGAAHPFPFSDRIIHRVELTGLVPDSTYHFHFGEGSPRYKFRTLPSDLDRPVRFAAGGDVRHGRNGKEWMMETNRQAVRYNLDFIVWGGDLAYADGREDRVGRWYEWFDAIRETLITEEGRVIPIVLAIGNHEVRQGYYRRHDDFEPTDAWRQSVAPYFYGLFAFPGHPGYNVLDFGDYLSLFVLDTAHTNPIGGAQAEWLEQALKDRQDVTHLIPVYHVPGYPSRGYAGRNQTDVRRHWVPLFEDFGVRLAFENHAHTYKRTHPIRREEVDPDGIVYMGDGAWGAVILEVPETLEWYLKKASEVRHFLVTTLRQGGYQVVAVSQDGETIDEVEVVFERE